MQRGHFRDIEQIDNPDAELVPPCAAAKPAIIVYGRHVGTTLTVCTDNNCPIHDPRAAARAAENPAPVMQPVPNAETEEQAEERRKQYEAARKAHESEQERRDEERRQQLEREEQEMEAAAAERDERRKERETTFERIVANAPAVFSSEQLRVVLRAIVNLDPYTFIDDLADDLADDSENEKSSAEEVLLAAIDGTAPGKLTGFTLRLALAGHRGIPRENKIDFLTEAENVFASLAPKKEAKQRKDKRPTLVKTPATSAAKAQNTKSTKKKIAA